MANIQPQQTEEHRVVQVFTPEYVARILAEPTRTELWHNRIDIEYVEKDVADFELAVDGLLRAFDLDPAKWADSFQRRSYYRGYRDVFEEHKKSLRLHPTSLGNYAVESLYSELDIEGGEDGDASIDIELLLKSGRALHIQGDGSFWTEYSFPNIAHDDERELDQLLLDDEETTDSEVSYRLNFTVVMGGETD